MHFQQNIYSCLFLIISFFLFESCSEKKSFGVDEINEQNEPVSPLWELLSSEIFKDTDRTFCFSLEFPVELLLSDELTKSLNSYEELISFSEKWYKENAQNLNIEPAINYPIKATLKDETLSELNDDIAFFTLIKDCLNAVHLDFFKMLPSNYN